MFFGRLKQAMRTLGFRVTLWNAVVVVLTATATLVGMQIGVRRALLHEMDTFLVDDLQDVGQSLAANSGEFVLVPRADSKASPVHLTHGRFVIIWDERQQVVWATDNQPPDNPHVPDVFGQPMTVRGYRIVQQRFPAASGNRLLVRVGIPLSVLDEDIVRVDSLATVIAGIMLLVAPLVGLWLSQRVIGALRNLIGRTSRLRPTQLDKRLPVRGSGDELDQLATTINGLLDRIASYLRQRKDFVANAAHELRTPVAAIRTTAEVALGSQRTIAEYESLLEDVIGECAFLEHLVNQLLLLSESDADRLQVHGERVRLDEIVRQSADMFGPVAEAANIRLDVNTMPILVEGHAQHLRQVVNNLLDNAIKFTRPGGHIHVELIEDARHQHVLLKVSDTGIGIAPEELPRVFERFYRCDRSRTHDGSIRGTGLGLSICQTIVEAHHGQVSVTSKPGAGSTFRVQLPVARLDAQTSQAEVLTPSAPP